MLSLNDTRLIKEQKEKLRGFIDELIEIREKELIILERMRKALKKEIRNLKEVKKGNLPLAYAVRHRTVVKQP